MTDQEKCIKLAKAMGWIHETGGGRDWVSPINGDRCFEIHLPDPFTDANDDYSVLEWMREQSFWDINDRLVYDMTRQVATYEIGDYAKAALKVIE